MADNQPIGIFDSGMGGLTVARELMNYLPRERFVYLGDMANLPYGTKSPRQIIGYCVQNTEFLLEHNIQMLVVACHSASSVGMETLKKTYSLPIVGVIEPSAAQAVETTHTRKIAVIGTTATITSHSYLAAIRALDPNVQVMERACPLLAPMVEEGWTTGDLAITVARKYLADLEGTGVDTLILGCTHYPLMQEALQQAVGPRVRLINAAQSTALQVCQLLGEPPYQPGGSADAANPSTRDTVSNRRLAQDSAPREYEQTRNPAGLHGGGGFDVFVTDQPAHFRRLAEQFLGHPLEAVSEIKLNV